MDNIKICPTCGKEFKIYYKKQKCCCRSCWLEFLRKQREEKFIGQKFNHWVVKKIIKIKGKNNTRYLCECECGTLKEFTLGELKRSNSCGCIKKTLNGLSRINTRLYGIHQKMKDRCLNPQNEHYQNYGARGITICKEWLDSYTSFYTWAMDNNYSDDLSIDRIDVNGNYEPSNCRWVTTKEQARNKRNTIKITINDETRCLSDWCIIYKKPFNLVYKRIRRGYDVMKALLIPPRTNNKVDILSEHCPHSWKL